MARPLRIEFADAIYHVTSRGNQRDVIVADDADRARWQTMLARVVERRGWRLFAFALMDNHYHLFLQTPEANLAAGLHDLNAGYVVYHNRRHRRVGHLFQGRYKAVLVEGRGHWLEVSRYVHLNPVRAGLAAKPEHWPWSSYPGYHRPARRVAWVNTRRVLSEFGGDTPAGRRRYRAFVEAGIGQRLDSPLARAAHGLVLGSDRFVAKIRSWLEQRPDDREVPTLSRLRARPHIEAVASAVAAQFGCDRSAWAPGRRSEDMFRAAAAYLAREHTGATLGEIAAALGYRHASSVTRACRRVEQARVRPSVAEGLRTICRVLGVNH